METKSRRTSDSSVSRKVDILALQDLDPALNAKMHLVNNVSDTECKLHALDLDLDMYFGFLANEKPLGI
jgi:hypothetical protein